MKRTVLAFFLLAALIMPLSACADKRGFESTNGDDGSLSIVATVFPYWDFARNIAPDVSVTLLLPPGAESHTYEPTASDILAVRDCDILLRTGGEGEEWVDTILGAIPESELEVVTLMDYVNLIEVPHDDHDEHDDHDDHDEHDDHGDMEWDQHIWTSPKNAMLIVDAMANVFSGKDPENADAYSTNAETYKTSLKEISDELEDIVAKASSNLLIFGDRFPFLYMASDYGLDYMSAFPNCGEESEPDARTLSDIISAMREKGISVVFHIELSSTRVAETISSETGAEMRLLHSCHNVTKEEYEMGATYLSLMSENLKQIKAALG